MYDKPIERLAPGDVIARTIRDAHGHALLTAGTPLTASYIDSLRDRGYTAVAVRDGLADDVPPRTHISASMWSMIAGHVGGIFGAVAEVAAERGRGRGVSRRRSPTSVINRCRWSTAGESWSSSCTPMWRR